MNDDKVTKLETDNSFLREKLKASEEERKKEIDFNLDLYSTIRLNWKASKEAALGSTDEERKRFLSGANCIELLSSVNPHVESVYCMDTLPEEVPLYSPDGVMFVKTNNPKLVAMMMRMYANSCDNLKIDKLRADQERRRNASCSSSHSQDDPKPS